MTPPDATAAELGYRMPAEWEPQACVWVVRPHNPETWPGCLAAAQAEHDAWVAAMREHGTEVRYVENLGIATNDSWVRDFGPIFVVLDQSNKPPAPDGPPAAAQRVRPNAQRPLALHDFGFNGWGGKYEVRDLDDAVPRQVAEQLSLPAWHHEDFILEGGSIDVDGLGTLLTTSQCLLNKNRNPHLSQRDVEQRLYEALNISKIVWLPGGILGDDTDGHVDDIARFVAPGRVAAIRTPHNHPDHEVLERNWHALGDATDARGQRLDRIALPAAPERAYDFPAGSLGPNSPASREPVPASYANFLISNGCVYMPVFGDEADDAACRVLDEAMPEHRIVPVSAGWLVVGLGALHCLSQQQPRVAGPGDA